MFNFFKKNIGNKSQEQKPQLNFIDRLEIVKYFEFTDQEYFLKHILDNLPISKLDNE